MTMTTYDDEAPRLAEIGRAINDFRHEFRAALADMVRKDVYSAEQNATNIRLSVLAERIAALESERKTRQNQLYAALGVGAISLIIWVIQAIGGGS